MSRNRFSETCWSKDPAPAAYNMPVHPAQWFIDSLPCRILSSWISTRSRATVIYLGHDVKLCGRNDASTNMDISGTRCIGGYHQPKGVEKNHQKLG